MVAIDFIPFSEDAAVIKVPVSLLLNVFKIRKLMFFSNNGMIVFACKMVAPKFANSFASEKESCSIFFASGTKSGFAVNIPLTCV